MYCFIKYAINTISEIESGEMLTPQESRSSMKINTYEDKRLIVNTNCPIQILLDYICAETGVDKNSDFDLCDEDGTLNEVKTLKPWSYATKILIPKMTYYIVLCQRDIDGNLEILKPLLNASSKEYADLILKLKKNITSSRRISMEKTKRRSKSNQKVPVLSNVNSKEGKHMRKRSSTRSAKSKKSPHS